MDGSSKDLIGEPAEQSVPAMTPQQSRFTASKESAFQLYKSLAVGESSLGFLAFYEILTLLCSQTPGLLGFGMRAFMYPKLFAACGPRPAIGRGVMIRNPRKITLGRKILIDDYASLDVRGEDGSITLEDCVSIGRFTTIAAKGGSICIGKGANIGSYCRIATQSKLTIGESSLLAAYCYVGPGNHQEGDQETPLIAREMEIKGGVTIGAHSWIGARATILDGVSIGEKAIVGAHSLVRENVPAGVTVAGCPAKVIR